MDMGQNDTCYKKKGNNVDYGEEKVSGRFKSHLIKPNAKIVMNGIKQGYQNKIEQQCAIKFFFFFPGKNNRGYDGSHKNENADIKEIIQVDRIYSFCNYGYQYSNQGDTHTKYDPGNCNFLIVIENRY